MGECHVYIACRGNVTFTGINDMGECHVYNACRGNVTFTGINDMGECHVYNACRENVILQVLIIWVNIMFTLQCKHDIHPETLK